MGGPAGANGRGGGQVTGKGRCWLSGREHFKGPDQTTRSLLTPAFSWHLRSTLAWGGELGACCVEHLLLFLASMDSVGLADEITGPLILCPGWRGSRRPDGFCRQTGIFQHLLSYCVGREISTDVTCLFFFWDTLARGLAQVTSLWVSAYPEGS